MPSARRSPRGALVGPSARATLRQSGRSRSGCVWTSNAANENRASSAIASAAPRTRARGAAHAIGDDASATGRTPGSRCVTGSSRGRAIPSTSGASHTNPAITAATLAPLRVRSIAAEHDQQRHEREKDAPRRATRRHRHAPVEEADDPLDGHRRRCGSASAPARSSPGRGRCRSAPAGASPAALRPRPRPRRSPRACATHTAATAPRAPLGTPRRSAS